MQIGRLRHKVEIWMYKEVQDEYGEPIKNWQKLTDAYAEIRPLLGSENFYEKMEVTKHTHKIMMRYFSIPLNATLEIRYNGRKFNVLGQPGNWMERNVYWQFNVQEIFDEQQYDHV